MNFVKERQIKQAISEVSMEEIKNRFDFLDGDYVWNEQMDQVTYKFIFDTRKGIKTIKWFVKSEDKIADTTCLLEDEPLRFDSAMFYIFKQSSSNPTNKEKIAFEWLMKKDNLFEKFCDELMCRPILRKKIKEFDISSFVNFKEVQLHFEEKMIFARVNIKNNDKEEEFKVKINIRNGDFTLETDVSDIFSFQKWNQLVIDYFLREGKEKRFDAFFPGKIVVSKIQKTVNVTKLKLVEQILETETYKVSAMFDENIKKETNKLLKKLIQRI